MSKFASDYPIETLRGAVRPPRGRARKVLARRAAYLIQQIERRCKLGEDATFAFQELAGIAVALEAMGAEEVAEPAEVGR